MAKRDVFRYPMDLCVQLFSMLVDVPLEFGLGASMQEPLEGASGEHIVSAEKYFFEEAIEAGRSEIMLFEERLDDVDDGDAPWLRIDHKRLRTRKASNDRRTPFAPRLLPHRRDQLGDLGPAELVRRTLAGGERLAHLRTGAGG